MSGFKFLVLTLHGQENAYYCVPATAQMISEYYGVYKSQSTIAALMHTVNPSGTSIQDEMNYYNATPPNGLGKYSHRSYISGYTYANGKAEIDANRPFSYHVYQHDRACGGYSEEGFLPCFYIYDPLPVGSGSKYWETFPVAGGGEFVYIQPQP